MKKLIEKFLELGGILFTGLIFIGIFLYYFNYFNQLQFFWIIIFITLGWLIYIYRYFKEEEEKKK